MKLQTVNEQTPAAEFLKKSLKSLAEFGDESLDPVTIAAVFGLTNPYVSRQALLVDLASLGFNELTAHLEASVINQWTFTEKLYHLCEVYLQMASEHPNLLKLMFALRQPQNGITHKKVKQAWDATFGVIERLARQAIDADQLKTRNSRSSALAIWSFIHGSAILMIKQQRTLSSHPEDLDVMYSELRSLLMKELVPLGPN